MNGREIIVYVKHRLFFLWRLMERMQQQYVTVHRRPMYSKDYFLPTDTTAEDSTMAIVLQGPIVYDNDFTLETVKLYKRIFPQTVVIVSTWTTERTDYVERLKSEGAEVLLNAKPSYSGPLNVNFQIVSTRGGMTRAQELGVEYVLKTRTDQRIYNPNSKKLLMNLIQMFPLVHPYPTQKQRIVAMCFGTCTYRLYHLSDILLFGRMEDMLLYWSVDLVNQQPQEVFAPERYFFSQYLKRIGRTLHNTMQDSWDAYAQHVVIVDHTSLDWFWYKKKNNKEFPKLEYHTIDNRLLYFLEWLELYRKDQLQRSSRTGTEGHI